MTAVETLRGMGACPEATRWAEAHGGTLAELWRDCPRGDWLLWYARKAGAPRTDMTRAAAGCAELALPYAGSARAVCEAAIAAARAWADAPGPGTARAAANAAGAAGAAYAEDAAYVTAYAARAAYVAANAAANAAGAARAAANAANAAGAAGAAYAEDAAANARAKMNAACADVVRACVPFVEVVR